MQKIQENTKLFTADGVPLKLSLARAQRRSKIAAFMLVFPLLLFAIIFFILPIADTTSVIINRLLKGQSPMIGGKDHTTHHLHYWGLNEKQIAYLFIGISILSLLLTLLIVNFIPTWSWIHFFGFLIYFLTISGSLYCITKISHEPDLNKEPKKS